MKNQYFGDINDYRKYGSLRCLALRGGLSIGVCWMLTPDDGRADGSLTRYLASPAKWRGRDPTLFDALQPCLADEGFRDVRQAPGLELIPGAAYFEGEVPKGRVPRAGYISACLEELSGRELLFFDPDNGIEIGSVPYGSPGSAKYVYWRELIAAFHEGHSLLVYQHYPRQERLGFHRRIAGEIERRLHPGGLFALRTSSVVYFLASQSKHLEAVGRALESIRMQWGPEVSPENLLDA